MLCSSESVFYCCSKTPLYLSFFNVYFLHLQALLGDKYGTQQLISEIPETEFEVLYDISVQNNMEGSELLTHYYLKDTNAVPISYRLQVSNTQSGRRQIGRNQSVKGCG